jgi:electron transport complex protein RnfG
MRDKIWFMAVVLGLVAFLAGLALAEVKGMTGPVIEKRILEQKIKPSLDKFFDGLELENDYIEDRQVLDLGKDARGRKQLTTLFLGKKGGKVVVAALQTKAAGFGGDIEVLTAFNLDDKKILGVKTLSQSETMGLGARVADDSEPFIQQFHEIDYTNGVNLRSNGGQVDAISGATVSSTAFTAAVNRATELVEKNVGSAAAN